MLAEHNGPWDITEHTTVYFNPVEQACKQVRRAGITSDDKDMMDLALLYFKASEEFDQVILEWEACMVTGKMWSKLKMFFTKEYKKVNKQYSLNAWAVGYGNANHMTCAEEEIAMASAALIQQVTKAQRKHVEELLTKTTDMMKQLMMLIGKPAAAEAAKPLLPNASTAVETDIMGTTRPA